MALLPESHLRGLSQSAVEIATHRIDIEEWDSVDRKLPPSAIADLSRSGSKVISFQLLANGMTRLTASSFVGRLRLGSVDLLLRPKLPIPSLLTILAEVHELPRLRPESVGFQGTSDVVDLLIHIFLREVDFLAQRGLKRTYVSREEELVPVRGRLDVRRTSALHMRARPMVWCSYDDYTLDGWENRALRSALRAIISNASLSRQRRRVAQKLIGDFAGVSDVSWQIHQLDSIACDRLTAHYEPALRLAKMILASMGFANEFGTAELNGFILNMNELFELYVYRRIKKLLNSRRVSVSRQVTLPFDRSEYATIRPDLMIEAENGRRMVADTKYKVTSKPDPADLYQMLAYCRVVQVAQGVLITAGRHFPRTYRVRDGETTIDVVSVDLDGPITKVHKSLADLADWIQTRLKSQ